MPQFPIPQGRETEAWRRRGILRLIPQQNVGDSGEEQSQAGKEENREAYGRIVEHSGSPTEDFETANASY